MQCIDRYNRNDTNAHRLGSRRLLYAQHKVQVRVASQHYKSPELLLGYQHYDYAIDMWGVGCILAGLLLRREPFFRGKDNLDQLGTIVAVLGTADLQAYISKANIEMTPDIRGIVAKYTLLGGRKKEWCDLLAPPTITTTSQSDSTTSSNPNTVTRQRYIPSKAGLDLLSKLLVYDHSARLTAKQAMQHTFFDPVRECVESQIKEKLQKLQQ